jgi:flagellar P-ring protein precursor FlgI
MIMSVAHRVMNAIAIAALVGLATLTAGVAAADRIKDLATVEGVRGNPLVGSGIVTGLAGTGDDASSPVTRAMLSRMLKSLGVTIDPSAIKAKNIAAVAITAELPPFARSGQRIDVNVTSIGGAKSLAGGTLMITHLKDTEGHTWALAQGPVAVGGFLVEAGGGSERKNHVTAARIPDGAIVEDNAPTTMPTSKVVLLLDRPDFTTATRIVAAIDASLGTGTAIARDAGAVVVPVTGTWRGNVPGLVAALEALEADPDQLARVVIDERTGTVVVGGAVRLTSTAIAYGGLQISIREEPVVSQPGPLAKGDTRVVPRSDVRVTEAAGELRTLGAAASVADVADALNALGARPRDLIAILQALVRAGALHGALEVL